MALEASPGSHTLVGEHSQPGFEALPQTFSLPEYDTRVINRQVEPTRIIEMHSGTVWLDRWRMSDQTEYQVAHGMAKRSRTDTLVVETTAWGTQVEGRTLIGANKYLELGYDVALVGPEIGSSIPMSHTAHNIQTILDELDDSGHHQPDAMVVTGDSRGAMVAFGMAAYSERHDRHGLFFDISDPCLAEKPDFKDLRRLARTALGIPAEIMCAERQLARLLFCGADLAEYAKTINVSIEGLMQFIRTGLPLFSGEAGVMANEMPVDTMMHVSFFTGSIANHREVYRVLLAKKPGVVITEPKGGHLSLLRRDTRNGKLQRLRALRDQLRDGVAHDEIDYSAIHLGHLAMAA